MAERLAAIPEVLQRVLDAIVSAEGVVGSATLTSLATQARYRILPLVPAAASDGAQRPHDDLHQIRFGPGGSFHCYPDNGALFGAAERGMLTCVTAVSRRLPDQYVGILGAGAGRGRDH